MDPQHWLEISKNFLIGGLVLFSRYFDPYTFSYVCSGYVPSKIEKLSHHSYLGILPEKYMSREVNVLYSMLSGGNNPQWHIEEELMPPKS
jgi:hypothetical protein